MSDMLTIHQEEGIHREPGMESNRFSDPEYRPSEGSFDKVAQDFTAQIDQVLSSDDPQLPQLVESDRQLLNIALGLVTELIKDPTSSQEDQTSQTLSKAVAARQSQIKDNNLLLTFGEGDPDLSTKLQQEIYAIQFLNRFSKTGSISQALAPEK